VKVTNLYEAKDWFQVFDATSRSQSAVMTLEPGRQSSEEPDSHPHSDQVLLVVEGEVRAEIAGEATSMRAGDVVIVPAGAPHKFSNPTESRALTFSVYAPPAYPE
jgi:mannose-6-phosphate isomerase-like protein (cupin superfamily)